jgi:hypothetical protein
MPRGTTKKGNAAELAVAVYLEMRDYTVHVSVPSKFHSNDILNVFDILAVKDLEPPRFIQVTDVTNPKSMGNISHRKKKVASVPVHVMAEHEIGDHPKDTPGCSVEVWGIKMKGEPGKKYESRFPHALIYRLLRNEDDEKYWRKSVHELYIGEEDTDD